MQNLSKLKLLLVEERGLDTEAVLGELRKSGFAPEARRVETQEDLAAELSSDFDLILADNAFPDLEGCIVAGMMRASRFDIPLILLADANQEERALAAVKLGAWDYVFKDRLGRLGVAAIRAIETARLKKNQPAQGTQLPQIPKTDAFGTSARDMAHDFNNLLTVMRGYCRMLIDDCALDETARDFMEEIDHAAQRAEAVSRQLAALGRSQAPKLQPPPVLETPGNGERAEKPSASEIQESRETILLVEDEEAQRSLTALALRRLGFQVIDAAHGLQAMALASDFCGKIDLLITDVVMPGMGGIEFAAWVGKEFPETKILFTSGHPNHGLTQSGALKSGAAFIAKPFESKTLVAAIRALLNAEP